MDGNSIEWLWNLGHLGYAGLIDPKIDLIRVSEFLNIVRIARVCSGAGDLEAYVGEGTLIDDVFGLVAVELLSEASLSFHDGGHVCSGVSTVEPCVGEVVHVSGYGADEVLCGEERYLLVGEFNLILDSIMIAFSEHIGGLDFGLINAGEVVVSGFLVSSGNHGFGV